jgi:1,4-alpha-glucan branching enzyme
VTFFRRGKTEKDIVIFACNFTPVPLTDHRIGVPFAGKYREVFNSDDQKYGGSGVINTKIFTAEKRSWDGRPYSIGLRVPPLAVAIIVPV